MLSVEEAVSAVIQRVSPVSSERVSLAQASGRRLVGTERAGLDLPSFSNSAMDGYALRAEDVQEAPCTLEVVGTVAAGAVYRGSLGPMQAIRIMTGAILPEGADTVVPQEDTDHGDREVCVFQRPNKGQFVRPRASFVKAGEPIYRGGELLRASDIGVLAAQGRSWVQVYRRPRVAVLTTGDELVPLDAPLADAQIYNSNAHMLAALVEAHGGQPSLLHPAIDEPSMLRSALLKAVSENDLVLTVGGVSVGKHDHVVEILEDEGQVHFSKVAMKPGKPVTLGTVQGTAVLGLPGNPLSAFVTFQVFVATMLRRMQGAEKPAPTWVSAEVGSSIDNGERRHLASARWLAPSKSSGEHPRVELLPFRGSGDVLGLRGVDAIADIPPNTSLRVGQRLQVLDLRSVHS